MTGILRRMRHGMYVLFVALLIAVTGTVHAEGEEAQERVTQEDATKLSEDAAESLFDELDTDQIDRVLKEAYSREKVRFRDVVQAMMDGEQTISPELIVDFVADTLFGLVRENRPAMLQMLLLLIVAAVFTNFSGVFQSSQIADCAFYIVYILLIAVCLTGFSSTTETVEQGLETLLTFMKVLAPAYFLCMTAATGSVSGMGFYQLILILIYLVELVIVRFVLPLVHVYLMVQILNYLSGEEYLSKTGELLETLISWVMKTMLACVTGVSVIQGILSPAIDQVKRSVWTKGAEMLPGIGDAIGGVTEVVLGTAVLIKNAVGMAGAVLAVGICLLPILNMGVLTILYKAMAAVVQPISDKRIVEVLSSMGNACRMLFSIIFTTSILFLVTIAVTAASTS